MIAFALAIGYPMLAWITSLKASRQKGVVPASLGVGLATGLSAALFLCVGVPLPLLAAVWVAAVVTAIWWLRQQARVSDLVEDKGAGSSQSSSQGLA